MIASTMILTGSLLILALAGYWMRRARYAVAKLRTARLEIKFLDMWAEELNERAYTAEAKLSRIIALETDRMAHVGKVAVAIAKGER